IVPKCTGFHGRRFSLNCGGHLQWRVLQSDAMLPGLQQGNITLRPHSPESFNITKLCEPSIMEVYNARRWNPFQSLSGCMSANRIHKAASPTEYPYRQH
ncbi:hypothetical protein L9F63_007654, partial [Diploptera punctata]